jgi:hypothetical protein
LSYTTIQKPFWKVGQLAIEIMRHSETTKTLGSGGVKNHGGEIL